MKLLMSIQPKDGSKACDPVLIDTAHSELCCLADDFLCAGENVLIFQAVEEYIPGPCGDVACDKRVDPARK